jgi:hypothetical protein
MKTKIFVLIFFLITPALVGAQNASEQDSGILSSIPDVQIDSAETYNNSTGKNTTTQSTLNWIIILALAFLGVILYSFSFDPKWVVILVAIIGLILMLFRLNFLSA